jgi:D-alanyl-D-alanine carboxypeptidase/D-alanyl-D-alanine-endopeptidase (penicillin-binding protein 4)
MTFLYRFFAIVLATILSVLPAQAVLGPDSIPAVFDQLLKNKNLSNPAMIVIDGSTGAIVYKKNAYQQRKPASVMKILTGAVMLEHLDPLATFSTTVGINPELGTVVIKGSYDPWMSPNHTIARKMNRASLPHIGTRTMNSVKEFNGGSLQNYKVIYNGLHSDDVTNLKAFWAQRNFKPVMKAVSGDEALLSFGQQIVAENSPTVAAMLEWIMLWSDNQMSERLARLSAKAAGFTKDAKGVEAVFRDILFKLEVDDSQLVVADASGLSRKNKITAKLMGELLYKLRKDEKYALIYAGLPVGGVSGTLETRFLTTAPTAVGLVKAKTGTLNGTATLAGYVQSTDREYVFVTLADEIPGGNTALDKARAAIDRVLGRIAAPNIPAEISPAP